MDGAKLTGWLRQRKSLLLTNPEFMRLWAGLSISVLGDWVGHTALTLHIYNVTGSASALAILTCSSCEDAVAICALVLKPSKMGRPRIR